jgi:dephospho-CoA kinase
MEILIVGKSGAGKSNFADILKNLIFKMDKDSEIIIDDPDRDVKKLGNGSTVHKIKVRRPEESTGDDVSDCDILIQIKSDKFKQWFDKI